jgi:hypothetical protein|tara:strand:- start:259 stop:576 length:318 start_codon:yes stop_codon:yes gene_type:complete
MPDGKTAVVPSSSVPFNAVSNSLLTPMTNPLLQAWADANPNCSIHDLSTDMTIIPTDDPRDLLPSEYEDPWPPSDAEIEMMQWLQDQDDLDKTVPSAAERNRSLK